MNSKEQLIERMQPLLPFVRSLYELTEEQWRTPIAQDKWPIAGIIGHMMLWDRYYMETAIEPIYRGTQVTHENLPAHPFNERAAEYAATVSMQQLLDEIIRVRSAILECLRAIPEQAYAEAFLDADNQPFTLPAYVADFAHHDAYHKKQILECIAK